MIPSMKLPFKNADTERVAPQDGQGRVVTFLKMQTSNVECLDRIRTFQ